MEEKEMKGFSLMTLFLVTGLCFLSFTLFLRIIDDIIIKNFLWIGLITFSLGLLTGADILIYKKTKPAKTN